MKAVRASIYAQRLFVYFLARARRISWARRTASEEEAPQVEYQCLPSTVGGQSVSRSYLLFYSSGKMVGVTGFELSSFC